MLRQALRAVDNGSFIDVLTSAPPAADGVGQAFLARGWRGHHVTTDPTMARQLQALTSDAAIVLAFDTAISAATADCGTLSVPLPELLDTLLDRPPHPVHWLRLPIDGNLRVLMASWQRSERRPWIVILEHTTGTHALDFPPEHDRNLLDKGYYLALFDGQRRYYVHGTQAASLGAAFEAFSAGYVDSGQLAAEDATTLKRKLFQLETQLRRTQAQAAANAAAAAQLGEVLRSSSWRITNPMRWFKHQAQLLKRQGLLARVRALTQRRAAARTRRSAQAESARLSINAHSRREQDLYTLLQAASRPSKPER